jgi:hypothetical protein
MKELTKITEEALNRYFITLSQFGYKKYSEVESLLVLLFIEDIVLDKLFDFVTESDYNIILQALECLYGSNCMIDFPKYDNYDSLIRKYNVYLSPRITEDATLRVDQKEVIRVEV